MDSEIQSNGDGAVRSMKCSARRRTTKHVLNIMQIFLFPICIAIAPGPASKVCMTIATMMFMSRLYIETLKAPNRPAQLRRRRPEVNYAD